MQITYCGIESGCCFREATDGNRPFQLHTGAIPAATLLVSDRNASRYLLTDTEGMLKGWVYPAKGAIKGIGSAASTPTECDLTRAAFSGIHVLTPAAMQMLRSWPETFSIIDFYLTIAATHPVRCVKAPPGAVITDIGKLSEHPSRVSFPPWSGV